MTHLFGTRSPLFSLAFALALGSVSASAQNRQGASAALGVPALPPPDRPVVLYSAEQPRIRVVPITDGLSHPWGLAFRRNGDILITERDKATLRVIRNGQLEEQAIPGVPEVFTGVRLAGLMDVAVHPVDDRLVGSVATSGRRLQDGRSLTTTGPEPPSCPATIRSNGVSSNQDSSSCVCGGTCGMP